MKPRVTISLDATLLDRSDAFAKKIGISRSSLVDVALRQFLSPEGADKREAALARRLDRLTRQYGTVERDIGILSETLALFIHQQLAIAPPIPVEDEDAIRAKGRERFEQFVTHLGRRLSAAIR